MGPATSTSSGSQRVDDLDILLPVLATSTDQRLYATIASARRRAERLQATATHPCGTFDTARTEV